MVLVKVKVVPALVVSGKDQDVSLREYSPDPASPPDDRALMAFYEPTRIDIFKKFAGLFVEKEDMVGDGDPPTEENCRNHVQGKLGAFPNFSAGPKLVMIRTIGPDGRWIPQGNPPPNHFSYAFLLQQTIGPKVEDYFVNLPVRDDTFLVARMIVVVQRA